jgi:hypothetical protein
MAGISSHWNKKKGGRGHTIMPIHYKWIIHPNDPKHAPFRVLSHVDWHGMVGFP